MIRLFSRSLVVVFLAAVTVTTGMAADEKSDKKPQPPKVGDKATDFELKSIADKSIRLSKATKEGPVVLLVLRGYPGYQCPICSRQVGDYLRHAKEFSARKARVMMVYPGPSEELQKRAKEFIEAKILADNFELLIDPDYKFTNAWGLRWDARRETAYPSTFVIDTEDVVRFAKISKTHGGRTKAEDVLKVLDELK